jgi:CubicO group peptidase (beta-lactamase class C family)
MWIIEEGHLSMSRIIGRREFLAGALVSGLMPTPGWTRASSKWVNVQTLLDRYVTQRKFAGASAALSVGGRSVDYVNAGALAFGSGVVADENSLWRIYSMTKPITATVAMILIEEGRMGLDQPVGEVLPALKSMKVGIDLKTSLEGRPASKPITMRNLLTHTAGLSLISQPDGKLAEAYLARGISPGVNGQSARNPAHPRARNLDEMIERLAELPLMAEPGTVWHYSIGLDVMGAVIERVSGKRLDAFMRERIFDPLDMVSTSFQVAPKDFGRLSTNYLKAANGPSVMDAPPGGFSEPPGLLAGGGGLVSSARDYVRFGEMLLGRGRLGTTQVMKSETAALMMSNLLPPGVVGPEGSGFGAGGYVVLPGPISKYGAPGSYGWSGVASTVFAIDPARREVIVFMTQLTPDDNSPVRDDLSVAMAKDLAA